MIYDLVGAGLGPFNLALAALADGLPGLTTLFCEQRQDVTWHGGLLLPGATLQVPFLADLVTLVAPTSRWSFLSYLAAHDRMFRFYLAERFHVPRREYDDYLRWVAHGLPSTRFGTRVESVRWEGAAYRVLLGTGETVLARNVALGLGTSPAVPAGLRDLVGPRVGHAAGYLGRRSALLAADRVAVVGAGQSGAEIVLDLLGGDGPGPHVTWLARSAAFAPMEYSKLGLEQFTPDYLRWFRSLPRGRREATLAGQDQLYKAVDAETLGAIYDLLYERTVGGAPEPATLLPGVSVTGGRCLVDGVALECQGDEPFTVEVDEVVLATGYEPRRPDLLADAFAPEPDGRFALVPADPSVTGRVYVQNGDPVTYGVGTPDLGLGAWRAAVILDDLTGGRAYRVPRDTAFTTFGGLRAPVRA